MIVLDTNVVSALMQTPRDLAVLAWLDGQPTTSVWITSITVLEIRFGIERLAKGRRRDALTRAFALILRDDLEGRVLGFGAAEAAETAALLAKRDAAGRPAGTNDGMIAGIVRVHRAVLATRNVRHFADAGIDVVNPWTR